MKKGYNGVVLRYFFRNFVNYAKIHETYTAKCFLSLVAGSDVGDTFVMW